jgi:hypothetical protein
MIDKTGIDIIGEYYRKPPGGPDFFPGRICDIVAIYLPTKLEVVGFDYAAANRGDPVTYAIGPPDTNTFTHMPVAGTRKLESDEALLVVKGKHRPGVILSTTPTNITVAGIVARDFPEAYLIVPLYSFQDTHPQAFRLRVQAFEYNMLFHIPLSSVFGVKEGMLRFDRVQVIPRGLLRPWGCALTDDALWVLQHWFRYFLTDELDRTLADFRAELLKRIP